MVQRNISGDIAAINDSIRVVRSKFKPLLDPEQHDDEVLQLIEVVPQMLDNVLEVTRQLEHAFEILSGRVGER